MIFVEIDPTTKVWNVSECEAPSNFNIFIIKTNQTIDSLRLENRTILIGDVMDKIKEIPENSIDCIISSPPYWALRDYGTGKWG